MSGENDFLQKSVCSSFLVFSLVGVLVLRKSKATLLKVFSKQLGAPRESRKVVATVVALFEAKKNGKVTQIRKHDQL